MPRSKTPIELHIEGVSGERQARYLIRRGRVGLKRVTVWVPEEKADELRDAARALVVAHLGMKDPEK